MTGARERHIERCRYNPSPKAERKVRIVAGNLWALQRAAADQLGGRIDEGGRA